MGEIECIEYLEGIEKRIGEIEKPELSEEEQQERTKVLRKVVEILRKVDGTILSETQNLVTGGRNFPDAYPEKGKDKDCLPGFGFKIPSDELKGPERFPMKLWNGGWEAIFFRDNSFILKTKTGKKRDINPEGTTETISFVRLETGEWDDEFEKFWEYIKKFLELYVKIKKSGKKVKYVPENYKGTFKELPLEKIEEIKYKKGDEK